MTYEDLIKIVGKDNFMKYGKGWYCFDLLFEYELKHTVDRYALIGMRPFYEVNQMYDESYHKNHDIGSAYDWLGENIEDEEEVKKYLSEIPNWMICN